MQGDGPSKHWAKNARAYHADASICCHYAPPLWRKHGHRNYHAHRVHATAAGPLQGAEDDSEQMSSLQMAFGNATHNSGIDWLKAHPIENAMNTTKDAI